MRPFAIGLSLYLLFLNGLYVLTRGRYQSPDHWSDLYFVVLAAYAAAPELKRWVKGTDEADPRSWSERLRKGGPIITAWFALQIAVGSWRIVDPTVPMPPELTAIVLKVIGLFLGTYAFRQYRKRTALQTGEKGTEESLKNQILEHLQEKGPQTPGTLLLNLGVSRRTLNRACRELVREKKIVRQGDSPTDPSMTYQLK